jgi:hypothetical protein
MWLLVYDSLEQFRVLEPILRVQFSIREGGIGVVTPGAVLTLVTAWPSCCGHVDEYPHVFTPV